MDHVHIREILRHRVHDGVLRRLIGKWLNAGVMERGRIRYPQAGTPQGGVISPLLANIYLHQVLDAWFDREVRPQLRGSSHRVRHADDCAPRRRGTVADGNRKRPCCMRDEGGPSEPADRGGFQTTGCCCVPMDAVVSDSEKVEQDSIMCGPGRRTQVNR